MTESHDKAGKKIRLDMSFIPISEKSRIHYGGKSFYDVNGSGNVEHCDSEEKFGSSADCPDGDTAGENSLSDLDA